MELDAVLSAGEAARELDIKLHATVHRAMQENRLPFFEKYGRKAQEARTE